MERREFLKKSAKIGCGAFLLGTPLMGLAAKSLPDAVWVENGEPMELVNTALQQLGGISRFVGKGAVVAVKPNIGWDRAPEFAANTNPEVVAAVVKACFNAGAKKVKVFDRTCNNPLRCYRNSQIEKAAKSLGADVLQVHDHQFVKTSLPKGRILKEWPIHREYLEADVRINIPIAKHHSLGVITAGLKNLMGVMGDNRGSIHNHFEQKLADITQHILPELTIIDAYRILLRNGPRGGNLEDVAVKKTLIASPCTVTADYLTAELFNLKPEEIPHVSFAYRNGLSKIDPSKAQVKRISLS